MGTPSSTSPRDRERERLSHFPEITASMVSRPGVLLADEIERCCKGFSLISPFSPSQLKPASYRLTVGSRYSLGGKREVLGDSGQITIPPFQVVVIQTRETLNLPRDIIARWNIKVSQAYEGLVWAGGPQVDPGYQGHLYCPIYNLSNKEVTIAFGDEIAVIDFVTTTAFTSSIKQKFDRPPRAVLLEDYKDLQSGLSDVLEDFKSFKSRIDDIETKVTVYGGIGVTMIGIIMAALSVIVSANNQIKGLRFSDWLCLIASGSAVAFSCWAWTQTRVRREVGSGVANSVALVLVGIFLGVLAVFFALRLVDR